MKLKFRLNNKLNLIETVIDSHLVKQHVSAFKLVYYIAILLNVSVEFITEDNIGLTMYRMSTGSSNERIIDPQRIY